MPRRQAPLSIPLEAGSPEWHAWRRTGIGSSDIPVITGDARWGDRVTLFQEKLGYTADRVTSDFMEAGHWLEDLVARWYAKKAGRRVAKVNRGLRSRSHEFAIASPDRRVPGYGLLEVKVTDQPGDRWGEPGSAEVPDDVLEQVQWQAHVADVEVVDVAVFFTRTRRRERYIVPRDPVVVDELLEFGADFWRCVLERRPPEPLERSARLPLRPDEIVADEEVTALVADLETSERVAANAQAIVDEVKAALRKRLTDVGGARGDGFRISYRPNRDSTEVNWQATALAYRDLIEEYGLDVDLPTLQAAFPRGLDGVIADLTSTKTGARPLVVRRPKEKTLAVA